MNCVKIPKNKKCPRAFDLITQDVFDLSVHEKYAQLRNVILDILDPEVFVQSTTHQSLSPTISGFFVPILTQPGVTYKIDIKAKLTVGDYAQLYLEVWEPCCSRVVPHDKRFLLNELEDYTFTFQAIAHETLVGIYFPSEEHKHTLVIQKMEIGKVLSLTFL